MKLTKFLTLLFCGALLVGCDNATPEKLSPKLSGLINQDVIYYVGKEKFSVALEKGNLATYEIIDQNVVFHLKDVGSTKFQIIIGGERTTGDLNIYDFSYSGERSTIPHVSTVLTPHGIEKGYTFSSSDETIAKINNNGTITPISNGTCDISLNYDGASYTKSFTVISQKDSLSEFYIEGSPVNFYGRNDYNHSVTMYNGASGFETEFVGSKLKAVMSGYYASYYGACRIQVEIDGERENYITLDGGTTAKEYTLVNAVPAGTHVVRVFKMGECGATEISLYSLNTDGYFLYAPEKSELKLEAYGDSITAGYGNMRGEGVSDGTSSLIQNTMKTYECVAASLLDAQINVMARSGIGLQFANNVNEGENMNRKYEYMHPLSNTKWNMHNYVPDVVIINLGTNDAWDSSKFVKNDYVSEYVKLVDNIADWYGNGTKFILAMGLMSQGNMTINVIQNEVYPALLQKGYECTFVQFANSQSNGHPLENEHKIAGELLAEAIEELL